MQPNFTPFPELITPRLLLRKISQGDVNEIFFLRSDENILLFIGKEPAKSAAEASEFITMIGKSIEANDSILWGIALKEDPAHLIGTICFWNLQKENYRAEIGYVLHPGYWRKGLMTEAIQKVMEYGFTVMQLHSVEARIHAKNTASAGILESTGFIKEGYLKEEFYFRGEFLDTVIYSCLRKSIIP